MFEIAFEIPRPAKESALADLREMEATQKHGELLKADKVREAVSRMILATRAKFLTIGEVLADRLAATGDAVKCRSMVEERINATLSELAEYPR